MSKLRITIELDDDVTAIDVFEIENLSAEAVSFLVDGIRGVVLECPDTAVVDLGT